MKLGIACDHAGYNLKMHIIKQLSTNYNIIDYGCSDATSSVDYPDFAKLLCNNITSKEINYGVLICGTGIGMSIAANRTKEIRAAVCYDKKVVKLARKHNNSNVICLGARIINSTLAIELIEAFISTSFEGGRHINRITKLC